MCNAILDYRELFNSILRTNNSGHVEQHFVQNTVSDTTSGRNATQVRENAREAGVGTRIVSDISKPYILDNYQVNSDNNYDEANTW